MGSIFTVDDRLKPALEELCRQYRVAELSVFGSRARGDERDESDLDLLVEFAADADMGLLEYAGLQEDLARLFHTKVDLVMKSGLKRRIKTRVLNESRLLYAR